LPAREATTGNNDIYIGNIGVAGQSNTIRIGDPAIHHTAFIAGIPAGGLAAILFDYNSGTIVVGVGGAVPFNQAPLIVGTAISKTNDTTFTVNADGVYWVSYTLRSDQVTIPANAGDTLQLVVSGVALTLAAGDNATINIDKIQ